MPLYECSKCHAVENTALTNFWFHHFHDGPQLCSECDPEYGEWHGKFPKQTVEQARQSDPNFLIEYPCKSD